MMRRRVLGSALSWHVTPDLKRCSKNVLNCENKSDEENGVRGGSPAEKKMAF